MGSTCFVFFVVSFKLVGVGVNMGRVVHLG